MGAIYLKQMTNSINNLPPVFKAPVFTKERIKEYFHDTLTEFEEGLSAKEIAEGFMEVLRERYAFTLAQHKHAEELLGYF